MKRQPRNSVLNKLADAIEAESRQREPADLRGRRVEPVAVDYAAIAKGQAEKLAAFRAREGK